MIPLRTLASLALAASAFGLCHTANAQGMPNRPADVVRIEGVKTTYVRLASGAPGVLYEPASPGAKAAIALFVMHASGDYLTFSACGELASRGYRVLCANNSTSKSGAFDDGVMDRVLLEMKAGIGFLRSWPGVSKIVLFGHSGGATLMTAYQMIAEGGLPSCQDAAKIHKCPDNLAGLPKADGVVLADANWGQAEMVLLSVDPSVIADDSGKKLDPALDMYNPANGYGRDGSRYSPAFRDKFFKAEAARNNGLIAKAQARLALIEAGKGNYDDDEPFIVAGASFIGNRLFSEDNTLLAASLKPWPLVHADGTVTTEIIRSLRLSEGRGNPTARMAMGALKTTVKNFLSSYAIRALPDFGYDEHRIRGVDWRSTYASPPGNAEGIRVPLLALGMSGHWEGLAAEEIGNHAASADKTVAFIEGASHVYTPCDKCVKPAAAYGDTVKLTYDFVDKWLAAPGRF
ncbi:alpha/beta hydrolase [Novosphingobium flavum]|uniref:Alpha/beta hydrolase n=1 Tax=Novosphingobium flavum TaxID=1778672 RepID=A0A7X1FSS7_9SPHN|nr:alpha/beta hydrolase [Novosphingobium flavum]MBC2666318.1 alpha/beta hydrolase [Novosphingobium flavum]